MTVDFHSHAFPEKIVERAMAALLAKVPESYRTGLDGRLSSLLGDMHRYGVSKAVLCQIATRPHQFASILDWALAIKGGEFGADAANSFEPLVSIHPDDEDFSMHLKEAARHGIKGVKFHPYYQGFVLDSASMKEKFRMIRDEGLFAQIHAGFDIGFPFEDMAGPLRTLNVIGSVPGLRLMVSHFGAWMDWDNAERYLVGADVDIEISMTAGRCPEEQFLRMLLKHPMDRLYFGSDWPWSDYGKTIPFIESLPLPEDRRKALMGGNAVRFLATGRK